MMIKDIKVGRHFIEKNIKAEIVHFASMHSENQL